MTVTGKYIPYRYILQAMLIKLSKNDSIWNIPTFETLIHWVLDTMYFHQIWVFFSKISHLVIWPFLWVFLYGEILHFAWFSSHYFRDVKSEWSMNHPNLGWKVRAAYACTNAVLSSKNGGLRLLIYLIRSRQKRLGVLLGAFNRKIPRIATNYFGLAEPARTYQAGGQNAGRFVQSRRKRKGERMKNSKVDCNYLRRISRTKPNGQIPF